MDPELITLAATAGTAVAKAAGTDAWHGFRDGVARLFSRGHASEAARQTALERLDRTAAELENAEPGAAERAESEAAASWRTRFQDFLESLDDADRLRAATQLQELVASVRQATGAAVGDDVTTIIGDVHIESRGSGAAAFKMGKVTITNPPLPGPDKT